MKNDIFGSSVDVGERLTRVRRFTLEESRRALEQERVQESVRKALRSRLRRLTKEATVLVITFEDHGQDFQTWTLDKNGMVIDCAPMQEWLWFGCHVTNMRELRVGSIVSFTRDGKASTIRYPLTQVTQSGAAKS